MNFAVKTPPGGTLTPAQRRNLRLRNIAIGLAVAALAALFYAITIVKMTPGLHHIASGGH